MVTFRRIAGVVAGVKEFSQQFMVWSSKLFHQPGVIDNILCDGGRGHIEHLSKTFLNHPEEVFKKRISIAFLSQGFQLRILRLEPLIHLSLSLLYGIFCLRITPLRTQDKHP